MRTPLLAIISTLFIVAATVATLIYNLYGSALEPAEIINAYIAIAACLGGTVSATFVIFSYIQTNTSYVESLRPHLLTQIENTQVLDEKNPGEIHHFTRIHYRNITTNRFNDLTISVFIHAENRIIDLSYLFRPKMTMIGLDARQRSFNTTQEIMKHGLDINQPSTGGNEVTLKLNYSYTYSKKPDEVNAQIYKWNPTRREWEIC